MADEIRFQQGDLVVYPSHGVGEIEAVEHQLIAGLSMAVYVIRFAKDRMTMKIPLTKATHSGLRSLASGEYMSQAIEKLKSPCKSKKTMWSRRAQEYEAKINSGDPISIAEVLRDLGKNKLNTEQSYSERQIYLLALQRLAEELAFIEKIDIKHAAVQLERMLMSSAA